MPATPTRHRFDPRALIGQTLALSPAALQAWIKSDPYTNELYDSETPLSNQPYTMARPGVALIQIDGVLMFGAEPFFRMTYERIERAIAMALDDLQVHHLVVQLETPGGVCAGLMACVAKIRKLASRRKIPITVHTSGSCCSAGAFLASSLACNGGMWVADPGADQVGMMGIYRCRSFNAVAIAQEGIELRYVAAGEYKVAGFAALGPDSEFLARDQVQVNEIYEMLCVDAGIGLAARRGISPEEGYRLIRAQESRTYIGNQEAIDAGVIDRVALLETVLDEAEASGGI